jgi:hypothetical protein
MHNILPPGVAVDVALRLDLWGPVLIVSVDSLDLVHRIERRIDFALATPDAISCETFSQLPVVSNRCNAAALADILTCVASDRDPLVVPLPPSDASALVVYEAPEEVETDVANLVHHLIGLILDLDVLPFVPILDDVHDDEMDMVIGNLVTDSMLGIRGDEISHFAIEKIETVAGPGVRPVLVTPEDIVGMLLWDTLLPEMPVRPREIEEMIADELDDIDIEAPDLDAEEEALNEEIERMVIYVPRKRIK